MIHFVEAFLGNSLNNLIIYFCYHKNIKSKTKIVYRCLHTRIGHISKVTRLRPCFSAKICPIRVLIEQLGGKPAPAVGWGMGIERMLLLLEAMGIEPPATAPDVFAIVPSAEALASAINTCEALRVAGVSVLMHGAGATGWGSMKSQFKRADASGARYALIFGADELARGEVALKSLRNADRPQRSLPMTQAATWAAELLNA